MEGNRLITLVEPQPTGEMDSAGELVEGPGTPYRVRAIRADGSGGSGFSAGRGYAGTGVLGGEWKREYRIRQESLPKTPTEDWEMYDEEGVCLRLEGVYEANSGPRARWLVLVCTRQTTARPMA